MRGAAHTIALPGTVASGGAVYMVRGDSPQIILAAACTLTTSATAGNRQVHVVIADASGMTVCDVPAAAETIASGSGVYSFGVGLVSASAGSGATSVVATAGLPPIVLRRGCSLAFDVFGAETGDTLSAVTVTVEDVPEPGEGLAADDLATLFAMIRRGSQVEEEL